MGVVILVVPFGAGAAELTGLAHAIDGDTILVGPLHVRLEGIDAPEMSQVCEDAKGHDWPCGKASRDRLAELVDGRDVRCTGAVKDAYGRLIATCRADGSDVERTLVAEGLAWAFRKYSATYIAEEDKARSAGIGIWAGRAEPPWEYRAHRWDAAKAAAPGACPIKGNINRKGEHIYHAPWSPWYARTIVNETAGERWFCDEGEAIAAGWRPATWRR